MRNSKSRTELDIQKVKSIFTEYQSVVDDKTAGGILSIEQMREMTAGGYQVFYPEILPPIPEHKSICFKKAADLKYSYNEFEGRTVAEIGSQLGFFSFTSVGLGAKFAYGIDANPAFVREANRLAVNFGKNHSWSKDRAKFCTGLLGPEDKIPVKSDIILFNAILHWWVIQNPNISLGSMLESLRDQCGEAVFFEGCVTAAEPVMKQNNISLERYNEDLFLVECKRVFRQVKVVGRCSYDLQRLVVRLYK